LGWHDNLLLVGKVIRPHGLEGLLRISSYARSERSFLGAGPVFIRTCSGEIHEERVLSVSPHKKAFLMKLEGIHSIKEAEALRGAAIFARKDAFTRDSEEEYFWHEIIGLEVYLNTGKYLGTVRHILPTKSNDIYVVQEGKSEVLIPAVQGVVEDIDLKARKMIVSGMEGLFDLNEV